MNPTKLVLKFSEFSTIFYTFYKILQSCITIEDGICHRDPCKESRKCNWVPRPWEAVRLRPIPASRRRSRPGKQWGATVGSPRVDGWSELGRRGCRRGGSTAAGGGCRGGASADEAVVRGGQQATLGGSMGSRETSGVVGQWRERAAAQVHRRRRQ
jgi:hypothetical protein